MTLAIKIYDILCNREYQHSIVSTLPDCSNYEQSHITIIIVISIFYNKNEENK